MSGAVAGSRYNFSRPPTAALPSTGPMTSSATPGPTPRLLGATPYTSAAATAGGGSTYLKTVSRYTSGSAAVSGGGGAVGGYSSSYGGAGSTVSAVAESSQQQHSAFKAFTPAVGLVTSGYAARSTYDEVASSHVGSGTVGGSNGGDAAGSDMFSSGAGRFSLGRLGNNATPHQQPISGSRF